MKIKLTKYQKEIVFSKERELIAYCGRRGGKTTALQVRAGLKALEEKRKIAYVAPTAEQAKEIFWDGLKDIWRGYYKKSIETYPQKLIFPNGSTVSIYSGKNYDRIRGLGLDEAYTDETSDLDERILSEVLFPALSDRKGNLIMTGTPKGFDWVYDLSDKFKFVTWTTLQGGIVSKKEIERQRLLLDERTFRQEYEASFESYSGIIFYKFTEANYSDKVFDKNKYTYLSFDFNVNPMTCLVFQKYDDAFHCVKEFVVPHSNTAHTCTLVKDFIGTETCDVTGDASGQSQKTSSVGKTDYMIIKDYIKDAWVKLPKKNPLKVDRWNYTNSAFESADKTRRLFINPKECKETVKNLRRITREDYNNNDYNNVTHTTDAFTYLAYNYLRN